MISDAITFDTDIKIFSVDTAEVFAGQCFLQMVQAAGSNNRFFPARGFFRPIMDKRIFVFHFNIDQRF